MHVQKMLQASKQYLLEHVSCVSYHKGCLPEQIHTGAATQPVPNKTSRCQHVYTGCKLLVYVVVSNLYVHVTQGSTPNATGALASCSIVVEL